MPSFSLPSSAALVILVQKGRHLDGQRFILRQRPYIVIRLDRIERSTNISKKHGGRRPTWGEQVYLPVETSDTTLKVSCYSKATKRKQARGDQLLGRGTLDVTSALTAGVQTAWVKLESAGKACGEVFLEISCHRSAAATRSIHPVSSTMVAAARFKRLHSDLGSDDTLKPPKKRLSLDIAGLTRRSSSWIPQGVSPNLRNRFSLPPLAGSRLRASEDTVTDDNDDDYVMLEPPVVKPLATQWSSPNGWSLWLTRPLKKAVSKVTDHASAVTICSSSAAAKAWNNPRTVRWKVSTESGALGCAPAAMRVTAAA